MKHFNKHRTFASLIMILIGAWLCYANYFLSPQSIDSVKQTPKSLEIANDQRPSESLSSMNTEKNSPDGPAKDPFKEFLEKKEKGQPAVVENIRPSYPPGFDPFKARLEEQKSEIHSAISPFSK